ncbi:MAG: DUF5682 family protein, partial [Bacteroidota bacterium]
MNLHVLGIRHHGPGSARSMLRALKIIQPDVLLIEGPADAQNLIPLISDEALIPPLAMLLYNPKQLSQAAYFPFADFSPEWQAVKYALSENLPVQLIDLPQGIHFALNDADQQNRQLSVLPEETKYADLSSEQKRIFADPLGYLAQLAGYEDRERWWEITFEEQASDGNVFPALVELMGTLRKDLDEVIPPREKLREAFMRKSIRDAKRKGFQNIAVVCGAWHAPALQHFDQYKAKMDNSLLKGLKKI